MMENPFEVGKSRYAPDTKFTYGDDPDYIVSQQYLATVIGLIALGLPLVMLGSVAFTNCFYDSISHFYYAGFLGDLFVVSLGMIGVFLLAYRGRHPKENTLAGYAGLCSIAVALFPTAGSGIEAGYCTGRGFFTLQEESAAGPLFELFTGVGVLHYAAAAFLFAFLAYYTLFVFTRPPRKNPNAPETKADPNKITRNNIYAISGIVILMAIFALLAYAILRDNLPFWNSWNLTFWFESLALWAFGVSWVVKGRLFGHILLDEEDKMHLKAHASS